MQSTITRALNLAIPVDTAAYGEVWVHSVPISREVFRRYYEVIARAWAKMMQTAGGAMSAQKITLFTIEDAARELGAWDGPAGVERGLIAEIHRLSNVVVPAAGGGWTTLPLVDAGKPGPDGAPYLDADDFGEVENAIAFFTLASATQDRARLTPILDGLAILWASRITSSNATEFARSLPTSMPGESSGETPSEPPPVPRPTSSVAF